MDREWQSLDVPQTFGSRNKAEWISGRIQTLLSHYFQTGESSEVREAALADWVFALMPFPGDAIQAACRGYLLEQPRRRPTPADIVALARHATISRDMCKSGNLLTTDELRVAHFAVQSGWLEFHEAEDAIIRGRTAVASPWITTPIDRALLAVQRDPRNKKGGKQEVNAR